ncbi:MAG: hypothetical protein ACREDA_03550, partial [Methylocella sp.]
HLRSLVGVEFANPSLPKIADDRRCAARSAHGAMGRARFASGSATPELHHRQGHDLMAKSELITSVGTRDWAQVKI